jgi:hypothetical protein
MSEKRDHSTHIRLSDEADATAELLAEASNTDKSKILADLLERCLLGEGHALKIAALRYSRLGLTGSTGA